MSGNVATQKKKGQFFKIHKYIKKIIYLMFSTTLRATEKKPESKYFF